MSAMTSPKAVTTRPVAGTNAPIPGEAEVAALFDRWNAALQSGDPRCVVACYAERSILLPTLSRTPRITAAEKLDYFERFLKLRPSSRIVLRQIDTGPGFASDAGLYAFTLAATGQELLVRYSFTYRLIAGQWSITTHHSSALPEQP
jgi:uncharacterized protein (TIGR02246 family)